MLHSVMVWQGGFWLLRAQESGAKRTAGFLLGMLIGVSLIILFLFKYFNFFTQTFFPGSSTLDLILPVGISFYTFTTIGYYVDLYRKECSPVNSFGEALLLVAFWPHLSAGPILRARNMLGSIENPAPLTMANVQLAVLLIASGLVKKLLLADNLGSYVNWNLDYGSEKMHVLQAWTVLAGFAGQIYADFSGYSDMAIGFALLLGFRLPANFNYPYRATSVTDFWRRWHISLSTWFRDYVYFPLGGSRKGLPRECLNILIVFLLSGLWHGAAIGFVLWGAAHGAILALEKVGYRYYIKVPALIRWLFTMSIVLLLWAFFRLPAHQAIELIARLFDFSNVTLFSSPPYILLPIWIFLILLIADHVLKPYRVDADGFPELNPNPAGAISVSVLLPLSVLLFGKELPFIYFQF